MLPKSLPPFQLFLDATYSSSSSCRQLEDHLVSKLASSDPIVRLKALRLIRRVSEEGCNPEFSRGIQSRLNLIKECLTFRGTLDPLRGDAPNKAVRDEAALAMKAIFSERKQDSQPRVSVSSVGGLQGFGSAVGSRQDKFGSFSSVFSAAVKTMTSSRSSGHSALVSSIVPSSLGSWKAPIVPEELPGPESGAQPHQNVAPLGRWGRPKSSDSSSVSVDLLEIEPSSVKNELKANRNFQVSGSTRVDTVNLLDLSPVHQSKTLVDDSLKPSRAFAFIKK